MRWLMLLSGREVRSGNEKLRFMLGQAGAQERNENIRDDLAVRLCVGSLMRLRHQHSKQSALNTNDREHTSCSLTECFVSILLIEEAELP
jgi:hypothetical protein